VTRLRTLEQVPVDKIRGYWRAAMLYHNGLDTCRPGQEARCAGQVQRIARAGDAILVPGLAEDKTRKLFIFVVSASNRHFVPEVGFERN
jgi:hypothetical protein